MGIFQIEIIMINLIKKADTLKKTLGKGGFGIIKR
jgi:hypothetical protein